MIKIEDLYLEKITVLKKYKNPRGEKKLRIFFDVVGRCIEICGMDQYLSLFHPSKKYEEMFDRIKCLISQKINISSV